MTEKEWIVLAYKEGKTDMAQRLVEEINQIDVYGTDEYVHGANRKTTPTRVKDEIKLIRRLLMEVAKEL